MFRIIVLVFFVFLGCSPMQFSVMKGEGSSSDSLTDSMSDFSDEEKISESDLREIGKVIGARKDGIHVFVFNVGQGNFCVIRDGSHAIVVDAGSSPFACQGVNEFKDCKTVFEACLCGAKIRAIIVTHADLDHYNFLKDLVPYMTEECFLVLGGSKEHKDAILRDISPKVCYYLDLARHFSHFVEEVSPGHLRFFEYAKLEELLNGIIPGSVFQFLQPLKRLEVEKKNDYSLVFKVTYCGNGILFTGDANGNTYEACFRKVVGKNVEKRRSKKENIDALKGVNLFMVPHHGADTEGSPVWTDVIIKYSATTLVGAIVSVGVASPYKQPTSFLHEKPWPYTMQTEKMPVVVHWKRKGQDAKKTFKNMHARILETWLSFGVFDFVFTNDGGVSLLEKKEGSALLYSTLVAKNIPIASCRVADFLSSKKPTELNLVEKFALRFLPEPFQKSFLGQYESLHLSTVATATTATSEAFPVLSATGTPPPSTKERETISAEFKTKPANVGYHLQDVPSDGNCAFWAILIAGGILTVPDGSVDEVIRLRNAVADLAEEAKTDLNFVKLLRTPGQWDAGMHGGVGLEALHYVARHLKRRIILIENEGSTFSYWDSGEGKLILHRINRDRIGNFLETEKTRDKSTILIYHEGNHFQAIVKK